MSGRSGSRKGQQETYDSSKAKYLQDRYREERSKDDVQLPWEGTHEEPKGEYEVELPYLGVQREFSEHQNQVALGMAEKGIGGRFLKHHVPLDMRGPYKLTSFPGAYGEREGAGGYAMCCGMTQTHNSKGERIREQSNPCRAKAINRSGFCSRHGGALHPLDRKRIDWEKAPRHIRFKYGRLPVDELDDEELSRGQIRKENGSFTSNQFVSAEIHDAMVKKLFERSDQKMRENLLTAVDTMSEIAAGTAYEPADRLRAAEFIFKWLRGQTPVKVEIGVEKPFEKVLDAIFSGGSREESRRRRGEPVDDILDAEVVDDEELDLPDLPVLDDGQSYEEVDEERDQGFNYLDERDRNVGRDLAPEPVIHYGPAGKATPHVPPNHAMGETEHEHYRRADENKEKAKAKLKKRKLPEEIAAERKAHKEEMRRNIAKRKGAFSRGQTDIAKPLDGTVEENEDGSTQFVFDNPEENE